MKLTGLIYFLAFGVMLAWAEISFRVKDMNVEFAPAKGNKKLAEMAAINFLIELPFTSETFQCRARKSDSKALPTTGNMVCGCSYEIIAQIGNILRYSLSISLASFSRWGKCRTDELICIGELSST